MNSFKKCITFTLSIIFITLFSVPFCMAEAQTEWEARTNTPDLRIGVISDSHITPYNTEAPWFKSALTAFTKIGANKLDGLALAGDIVYFDNTTISDAPYDTVYTHINTIMPNKPVVFAMGNHEFPQNDKSAAKSAEAIAFFEEKTSQPINYHTTINNFHFITSGAKDYNGEILSENEQWLMQEIDKAIASDNLKPVFLMLHHPIAKTVFNESNTKYSEEFLAFLKARPQVINIVAHEHVAAQLPQCIWQDGFTVYQSPLCANGNVSLFGTADQERDMNVHTASMIEVENNVVKIFKLDLSTNNYIGEPWVIDIPSIVNSLADSDSSNDKLYWNYSADKSENTNVPYYPAGASVSADVSDNTVVLTYSSNAKNEATGILQDGFIRGYKIELKAGSTIAYSNTFQSDFYKAQQAETQSRTITGLGYDVDYTATVYPMSPFGIFGEGISTTFTTEPENLPDGAVRYEFEDYISSSFVINNTSASKRKLVGSKTTMQNPSFSFNIELENAGYYDLTYALGHNTEDWVSLINLKVDNNFIGDNDKKTSYIKDISQNGTYAWSYMPMRLYETKGVYLSSGKHIVTFEVNLVKNDPTVYKFFADYIQFTPNTDIKTVKKGEKTRFEFEDYSNRDIVKNLSYASKEAIVCNNYGNNKPTIGGKFVVNKSGYYSVEYLAGHVPTAQIEYLSSVAICIDGKQIGTNDTSFTENLLNTYTHWKTAPMSRYKADPIWLEEGEHTFSVEVAKVIYDNKYKYQLDYMEFSSVNYPPELRLEAEKFANINIRSNILNASNNQLVGHDYGTEKPTIKGSFEILESGYYDFTYIVGHLPADQTPYISTVTFFIDEMQVGVNDLNYIENLSSKKSYYWDTAPMSRYVTERIWLDKKTYTLNIDVSQTTYDNKYKYQVDYVELTPSDNFTTYKNNTFSAGIWLPKKYTGTAIIALYSGNKLVGTKIADLTDEMYVSGVLENVENVTSAKLFIWKTDLNECSPLIDSRELTITTE